MLLWPLFNFGHIHNLRHVLFAQFFLDFLLQYLHVWEGGHDRVEHVVVALNVLRVNMKSKLQNLFGKKHRLMVLRGTTSCNSGWGQATVRRASATTVPFSFEKRSQTTIAPAGTFHQPRPLDSFVAQVWAATVRNYGLFWRGNHFLSVCSDFHRVPA